MRVPIDMTPPHFFFIVAAVFTHVIGFWINENIGPQKRSTDSFNYNNSCECGLVPDSVGTRIVGGNVTVPHTFPWMVAILYYGQFNCGGTLINDLYVLTAAHCVTSGIKAEDLSLILGMHDRVTLDGGTEKVVEIDQVIVHEDFGGDHVHVINDVALIKLKIPRQFNNYTRPVCLPTPDRMYDNHDAVVTGWGHTARGGHLSRFLRKALVRILSLTECRNTSIGEHIMDNMLCTYAHQTDACQGDSGGPLMYEESPFKIEQIGVVSWGIGCARPGMPGISSRITDYISWIRSNTLDATYCARY